VKGPLQLIWPRLRGAVNGFRSAGRRSTARTAVMAVLGLGFWAGAFVVFYRTLSYFKATELIGDLLAYRLMELVFLSFFSVLVFSNVITALSTFYLSGEMQLILSSPVPDGRVHLYKYAETIVLSSWMVAVFGLPVFLSYGIVYGSGPGYYALSCLVFALFILIPAPVGMMLTMLLVRLFPAKRTKDIMFFLSLVLVVLLYFLIRFMQPEKLVDPEAFGKLAGYIASLKTTSSPLLPSYWASMALWPAVTGKGAYDWFWLGMLASTAAAMYVICGWVFHAVYRTGYSRAQEGGRYRTYGLLPTGVILDRAIGRKAGQVRSLVLKDVKTFFRDTTQWSQLFLLGALVVVYIYNFRVLPIERFPFATFFLENFIAFLNLGLAGFVLAAVAVRFVFPSVSLEGESFWVLKTSPVSMRSFIWAKFWSAWLPLVLLAEALIVVSNHFLHATFFMTALSCVAIFLMSFGITGLGVGLGAIYPRFRYENAAQISAGYGGIIYMLVAMCFIGAVVLLLSWPVYMFINARYRGMPMTPVETGLSVACFAVMAALDVAACIWPMRWGLAALEGMEL
jgi:ABC-2 type transport system permease protein